MLLLVYILAVFIWWAEQHELNVHGSPSFCILYNWFLTSFSKHLYKSHMSSWCRRSQLAESRMPEKSSFSKRSLRSHLQLMHHQQCFWSEHFRHMEFGENCKLERSQDLALCSILDATQNTLFSPSCFLFLLLFCFQHTKQLVYSTAVSLLTCRSRLWPCRQLRKGNNATLCPDLSLPSLMFQVGCVFSKDCFGLCFPWFVELFPLGQNGYEMNVECLVCW